MTINRSAGVFTPEKAREIERRVLGASAYFGVSSQGNQNVPSFPRYAVLDGDLGAATNPLDGYTIGYARLLKYTNDGRDMEVVTGDANRLQIINRSLDLVGSEGDLVILAKIQQEIAIIWIDCTANTSSDLVLTPTPSEEPP